jgi:hypothetical protein
LLHCRIIIAGVRTVDLMRSEIGLKVGLCVPGMRDAW